MGGSGSAQRHDAAIFAREVGVRANGLGWLEAPARRAALEADGCTEDEVLEATVDGAIRRKAQSKGNLCSRCWHDCAQRCMSVYASTLQTVLQAKVLVLMHHKEYLNAGDDASSPCSLQANPHATPAPTPTPTPQPPPQPHPSLPSPRHAPCRAHRALCLRPPRGPGPSSGQG